jgi:hypothetical protein
VEIVELVAVVAFVGVMGLLVARLVRRDAGEWEAYHRFEGGRRRVYVRRGSELEPVGSVDASDPEYEDAFLALMDRARERAAALNSELRR